MRGFNPTQKGLYKCSFFCVHFLQYIGQKGQNTDEKGLEIEFLDHKMTVIIGQKIAESLQDFLPKNRCRFGGMPPLPSAAQQYLKGSLYSNQGQIPLNFVSSQVPLIQTGDRFQTRCSSQYHSSYWDIAVWYCIFMRKYLSTQPIYIYKNWDGNVA